MKYLILAILLTASPFVVAENPHQWRTGLAIGADPNGEYAAATLVRSWVPVHRELNWGVRTYLELGRYNYDGNSGSSVTVAVEPVVTWRGCYAGIGPSLGNTTPRLGTVWNISSTAGCDFELDNGRRLGFFINHQSHCARCGIEEDRENGGKTTINAIFTF